MNRCRSGPNFLATLKDGETSIRIPELKGIRRSPVRSERPLSPPAPPHTPTPTTSPQRRRGGAASPPRAIGDRARRGRLPPRSCPPPTPSPVCRWGGVDVGAEGSGLRAEAMRRRGRLMRRGFVRRKGLRAQGPGPKIAKTRLCERSEATQRLCISSRQSNSKGAGLLRRGYAPPRNDGDCGNTDFPEPCALGKSDAKTSRLASQSNVSALSPQPSTVAEP